MAWHAICEQTRHGNNVGKWRGPGRKEQSDAEEDAIAHNKEFDGHTAGALEDTVNMASEGSVEQGTEEPQGTEEQQGSEES